MKKKEQEINRYDLIFKPGNKKNKTYSFQIFGTIRSFDRKIYGAFITLNDSFEEQINVKNELKNFNEH